MCGIAGVVNLGDAREPPSREVLARMVGALRHRGPDAFGLYRDRRAALGHARLSIVDLATGQQPMANEDRTLWVTFNGEIFNYVELRAELAALGHAFRTRSDTEVIVHAWEAWGPDALERFNGQWAFALWDARAARLVLCRDRLGVRPLHWTARDGRFWFASELKALFADTEIPRQIDPHGLDQTFTFWSVVAPQTMFRGVRELRPGHALVVDAATGSMDERRYWRPRFPRASERLCDPSLTIDHAAAVLRDKLSTATRLRMVRADVPVGAYVSGGIDSALVAAMAREVIHARLRTFSLRFADDEFDEGPYQREMVRRLGSEHTEIRVTRDDIAAIFPEVVLHTERPILRTAPAPLLLLSRHVRESGINVVLTGEGADEVFAGYDLFREAKIRRFWARRPASRMRPRLFERIYPYLRRSPAHARGMALAFWARGLDAVGSPSFAHAPRWQSARALGRLFSPDVRAALQGSDPIAAFEAALPHGFTEWSHLAQAQHIEMETLLAGYLLSSQGDRMLMANSVEGRFPFLDRDVVEFGSALPDAFKLCVLDEKHIVKRAAAGLVPDAIVTRTKQPYRAPDALAFVAGARVPAYVHDLLSARALAKAGIFDALARSLVEKCIARGASGEAFSNADNMAFVGMLSTQMLHHHFIASSPAPARDVHWTTLDERR